MTDLDLADRLDAALARADAGLRHDPLPALLAAGRRSVRRRRLAGLAGSVAAIVAVGAVGATVTVGQPAADRVPASPTGPSGAAVSLTALPGDQLEFTPATFGRARRALPARYTADRVLEVDRRATVLQFIDNPIGLHPPDTSVALRVRTDRGERWVQLTTAPGNGPVATAEGPAEGMTFAEWARGQSYRMLPNSGPTYFTYDDGEVVPYSGVPILGTIELPDLDGVAVEVRHVDRSVYVLARKTLTGLTYFPIVRGPAPGETLEDFAASAPEELMSGRVPDGIGTLQPGPSDGAS